MIDRYQKYVNGFTLVYWLDTNIGIATYKIFNPQNKCIMRSKRKRTKEQIISEGFEFM